VSLVVAGCTKFRSNFCWPLLSVILSDVARVRCWDFSLILNLQHPFSSIPSPVCDQSFASLLSGLLPCSSRCRLSSILDIQHQQNSPFDLGPIIRNRIVFLANQFHSPLPQGWSPPSRSRSRLSCSISQSVDIFFLHGILLLMEVFHIFFRHPSTLALYAMFWWESWMFWA